MPRLALVFLFGVLLCGAATAGCRTKDPAEADPVPDKPEPATVATASATGAAGAGAHKARGIELLTAPPGNVPAVVKAARDEARTRGRKLLVYIGATWCEPCQHFHHAAEAGELDAEFPTLSLLVFDADRDGDRLRAAGYAPGYIPYFGVPDEAGGPTRDATEGAVKGEGAVAHITPRLAKLVADAH
jgi:thiol-disulfide isomerase/thioredoxin